LSGLSALRWGDPDAEAGTAPSPAELRLLIAGEGIGSAGRRRWIGREPGRRAAAWYERAGAGRKSAITSARVLPA
jgi:hypothetical protein